MLCGESNYTIPTKRLAKRRYEIRENEEESKRRRGLASVAGEIESHVSAIHLTY